MHVPRRLQYLYTRCSAAALRPTLFAMDVVAVYKLRRRLPKPYPACGRSTGSSTPIASRGKCTTTCATPTHPPIRASATAPSFFRVPSSPLSTDAICPSTPASACSVTQCGFLIQARPKALRQTDSCRRHALGEAFPLRGSRSSGVALARGRARPFGPGAARFRGTSLLPFRPAQLLKLVMQV